MEESRCSAVVELFTKFPPNAENNMGVKLQCIPQREEKKNVWIKYHTLSILRVGQIYTKWLTVLLNI